MGGDQEQPRTDLAPPQGVLSFLPYYSPCLGGGKQWEIQVAPKKQLSKNTSFQVSPSHCPIYFRRDTSTRQRWMTKRSYLTEPEQSTQHDTKTTARRKVNKID